MEKVKKIGIVAVILLLTTMLPIPNMLPNSTAKAETQSISPIEDPSPDYRETSLYMIGSVAVGVIFLESNGTTDLNTENWTSYEESAVIEQVKSVLNWWSSQNLNANVTFILDIHYKVPTSYEPITHPWYYVKWECEDEAMAYLGYQDMYPVKDYLNALRYDLSTDWVFAMFFVDASNDDDGLFADGHGAYAYWGESLVLPVKTTYDLDWRVAHETAHIFFAEDEYFNKTWYNGYLNVSCIPGSGCIMDKRGSWSISGKPHGMNGTWGQIGWRDSDGDGIQDIVDTFPRVYLNPYERIGNKVNFTGVAAVTPYPNLRGLVFYSGRNITIDKIRSVQYRIDNGTWLNATVAPTKTRKRMKYDGTYIEKNTTAIVNFTFLTEGLTPGNHTVEVKATNQWGNSGFVNSRVTVPEIINVAIKGVTSKSIVGQGYTMNISVTVQNQGEAQETFNITVYANDTEVETKQITLSNGTSTILTFTWNTTDFAKGNYTIKVYATAIPGETDTIDNTFINGYITITIPGDVDGDKDVDLYDVVKICSVYGSKIGDPGYDANLDINSDEKIDLYDAVIACSNYGQRYP